MQINKACAAVWCLAGGWHIYILRRRATSCERNPFKLLWYLMRANCGYLTGHLFTISGIYEHSLVPHKNTPVERQIGRYRLLGVIVFKNRSSTKFKRPSARSLSGIHFRYILKILSLFVLYWKVVHYWEATDSCLIDKRPQASRGFPRSLYTTTTTDS